MKSWIFVALFFFSIHAYSQNIFSEGEFDYKKPFAPYESQNVAGLEFNEFIILNEYQKGSFKLSRLDEYFIDRWSKVIEYGNEGSFPKLIKVGNEVIVFRYWTLKNKAFVESRVYDIETGEMTSEQHKILWESEDGVTDLKIKFSPSRALFMIYNTSNGGSKKEQMDVYSLKSLEQNVSYSLPEGTTMGKYLSPFLNENGEVFLALGDAGSFTLDTYFFSSKENSQPAKLTSNFTFARPAGEFSSIKIIKQSESTYFVQTIANIESEIVGINLSSFNVVLKSILFSNTINIDESFVKSAYEKSVFTSENQKKKYISTPDNLSDFDAQEILIDVEGNITAIFEKQELPSTIHSIESTLNFGLKWKEPEEKYYASEDLLLVNFSSEGEINWKRVIQKSQLGQGTGLTLSYLSYVKDDAELRLVMKESAKGNSIYYFSIDLTNGEIITKESFIDKKIEINKNYSAWINDKTLLLCGNAPGSNKRNLYLIEF